MATRGAIERVDGDQIGGWIMSGEGSLRDAVILAFLGSECIGAGRVDQYRPDIAVVGLGDGYAGFQINISPVEASRAGKIYVKLEGHDTILVGSDFHAHPSAAGPLLTPNKIAEDLESIRWMRDRNWLSHADADVLRTLARFGVYEMGIPDADAHGSLLDAGIAALTHIFGLVHRRVVPLEQIFCPDSEALRTALQTERERTGSRYVALWSAEKNRVTVAEGSHIQTAGQAPVQHSEGVEYEFGGRHLLILDRRVTVFLNRPTQQILLLTAKP